jgi:thioredoxin reductase
VADESFDVVVVGGGHQRLIAANYMVRNGYSVGLIAGKTPNDQLHLELEAKVKELYKIGEARNPHSMGEANRDGHFVGRLI